MGRGTREGSEEEQENLRELEASLIYAVSSRTASVRVRLGLKEQQLLLL